MTKLTPAAKRYALELVKRRKIQDEHANCVQPGFVVRYGVRLNDNDEFVERPYSVPTYETDHHNNCQLARIIPRNYCRHGNFVGDPWGPDYMCGFCENGDDLSLYEIALDDAREHQRRLTEHVVERAQKAVLEELVSIYKADANMAEWIDPDVIAKLVRAGD